MAKKKRKIRTTPEEEAKLAERRAYVESVLDRTWAEVKAREAKASKPQQTG
jgi:hypothetical protein